MPPRIRLTVVDAGPLSVDRSDLMHGASGTLTVPSTVVVIEHAQHGLVLFDTGINHRVADPELARRIGARTSRALRRNGVHP